MIKKKVLSATMGEMTVHLSPMALQDSFGLTNDGNNAENIDELLYIKRPQNGFPVI